MNHDQENHDQENHDHNQDNHDLDEYPRPSLEDIAMASEYLPLARANILDYLYISGISLPPIFGGVVAGVGGGGGAAGGGAHIDGIASILANSLYDCRPVKTVVDEKGMAEISEKIFTAQLAEELKINTVCGIWQEDFEEGEPIKILPCNHAFKIDAIEKWLTTEKAECPICRFSLSSKEVICHPPSSDVAVAGAAVAGGGGGAEVILIDEQHIRNQDVSRINENNIAARLVDNIQNRPHHEDAVRVVYVNPNASLHSRQSISVPINQLLHTRRNMIDNLARASGGGARVASQRRPMASSAPPVAAAAEPAAAEPAAHPQYINNNYYFGNIINHQIINNNEYEDADDAEAAEHDNNRYNLDNYNNYNNNHISNQERDDIQEAIRRSLEE